jgi:chitodextrinase
MAGFRVVRARGPLSLLTAVVPLAVLWLAVGTGTAAHAVPSGAPAAAAVALTSFPPPPSLPDISPYPPGVPSDLHVVAVTSTSITLAWTASTSGCCGVAGYDIVYGKVFNDVLSSIDVGNVTTFTFGTGILPATQYTFRLSARDGVGHRSASSNTVTVVTPLSDSGPDTTPPSAPANLKLTGVTSAGAALIWSTSTDDVGVTGYNVYRYDGGYISTLLATITGTSYTASLASTHDIFYVRARDAAGNVSIASNSITAPVSPPSPSGSPSCRVTYAISSQWAGGFVADLKVSNTGMAPITGWRLTFQFGGDQRVASAWNATFSQAGAVVTLDNMDYNRAIEPGSSTSLGMLGSWASSNAVPTAISLNGVPCVVG